MSGDGRVETIANYHCRTGEGPLWDERRGVVYWTDIPAGRLLRYEADTGRSEQIYSGPQVGGLTLQEDGALLLFGEDRIWLLGDDGSQRVLVEGIDADMTRFNDAIADPAGRVFAGTIARTAGSGGLYRLDRDGSIACLFKGTDCANGMGFSPDRRRFYWTCTTSRKVFRFDYDEPTGELSGREVFLDMAPAGKNPDGMTVDSSGGVWSAEWGGCGVSRYSAAGEFIERIDLPVAKVSSVAFGGAGLDELYITTAGGREGADTPDGALFRVKVAAKGLPEFRSRVTVP